MHTIVVSPIQCCPEKVQMSPSFDATIAAQTNPGLIRLYPAYALAAHLAERHLLGYLMLNGEACWSKGTRLRVFFGYLLIFWQLPESPLGVPLNP